MENLTMKKLTKANTSRLAITKVLLNKIIENDEMCRLLMYKVVKDRQYILTRISNSDVPKEEKSCRMKEQVEITEENIRKTANDISELHQEMEKELEELEVLVMNTDGMEIFRTFGAYFLNQIEYITFKEMEKIRTEDLRESMNIYMELILTEPGI